MIKASRRIYPVIFFCLFLCSFAPPLYKAQQQNQAPVVKIIAPKNNGFFDWGTQINYQVSVVDKEDGDTKFEEINALEVLLEVRYINNKAQLPAINKSVKDDPAGLAIMRTSNCFNCHNFNTRAIGPSFNEVSARYPVTAANVDLLVKHIREGSAGVWGKAPMPTHPELSAEEAKEAANWLLKQATNPNVSYYTGIEGSFRTKQTADKKGAYVLTASYTDHGLKNTGKRLKGQDVVILQSK